MLSTQDFAHEVWLSLENIRERLAVLETEARHTRCHLQRLERRLDPGPSEAARGCRLAGAADGDAGDAGSGAVINVRVSRKTLGSVGGGGALGGGLLTAAAVLGRALGWW